MPTDRQNRETERQTDVQITNTLIVMLRTLTGEKIIIHPMASGEYCKYSTGQKNGLHAFGYNSAETEPITVKFGTL